MAPRRLIRGDDASHIRAGHQGTTLARSHWVWGGWRPTLDARAAALALTLSPLVPALALFSGPPLVPTLSGVRGHSVSVFGELGRGLEWVEDNLGMRAATVVARMVEKGRVVGLGASQGVL